MESQKNKFAHLRKKAEKQLDSAKIEAIQDEEIRKLVHELQVHQIELEIQNEELHNANEQLKEAREELEISRNEYLDLYDFAPVGYCTFDKEGIVLKANLTLCELLGIHRNELIDTSFYDHIVKEDKDIFFLHLRKAFETGRKEICEVRLLKDDDSWFYAKIEGIIDVQSGMCRTAISDITLQKQMEKQLKANLKEKTVLVQEIHHRVKNNMNVVISLLGLHLPKIRDGEDKKIIKDIQRRIKTMALVHQKLYKSPNLANINFSEYIKELIDHIFSAYRCSIYVTLKTNLDDVPLSIEKAIPCGMILNELVTNSLEHGFGSKTEGAIFVDFHKIGDKYTLSVANNGVEFPTDFDWQNTDSMGLRLVNGLVKQLGGTVELDMTKGTKFAVTF